MKPANRSSEEGVATVRCSVVIPTWKRASLLQETLTSLEAQTSHDFEVVVVCDGEDTGTRGLSEDFSPWFELRWLFHPSNLGLPTARNNGVMAAKGEVILFLDDDTPADESLVCRHLQHFQAHRPDAHIAVYGTIVDRRQDHLPTWTDRFLQQSWERTLNEIRAQIAAPGEASVGNDIERAICFGVNCSIRRDLFLGTGGFLAELRNGGEELEYGHRLYRQGVRFVVDPGAIVYHKNKKNMTESFRRAWYFGGELHVKQVFEFGQRNPQTQQLAGAYHGSLATRVVNHACRNANGFVTSMVEMLQEATNRTGSRLLFGAWARLCQKAEYWRGVEDTGCSDGSLRAVTGQPLVVLGLHSISTPQTDEEGSYCLRREKFHRFMHWLRAAGYDLADPSHPIDSSRRGILLTFDDGYEDLYRELLPAMIRHRLKPIIFLVAGCLGRTNVWDHSRGLRWLKLMNVSQIREMQKYGAVFGSHTLTHPWLPSVSDQQLRREVEDSKSRLEDILGAPVTSFAYPCGRVDQRTRAAVAEAGYEFAFTTRPGVNWWNDPLCQNRAEVRDSDSFLSFLLKLHTGYSVREWLAAHLHELETQLPTATLRDSVKTLHAATRRLETFLWQANDSTAAASR